MRHTLIIHVKVRPEHLAELYGPEAFDRVFSSRSDKDFPPVSRFLRNCEGALERGLIDRSGSLLVNPE